ncbi:MAG: peptidoglycan-binding protein [Burkholderiales bacterium]|nr:peptidoglycan-binding protein [Burkholderiales bacterium]
MNMKLTKLTKCAGAVALALTMSTVYAADNATPADTSAASSQPMTGKQKATAIGATTGAVAGAVVGGPVGAVVGAGIGGYVGHEGTDANGKVPSTSASQTSTATGSDAWSDGTVRSAQAALVQQGYNPGEVDGRMGPNTRSAVMKFQKDRGLTPSGSLDRQTQSALGISHVSRN